MRLYYRISDRSYPKFKLPGATKEFCLMNFCQVFEEYIFKDDPKIRVIADWCERKTLKMLRETGLPMVITNDGNAGSFRKAFELAISEDEDTVYFCEDDYLHLSLAPKLIEEIANLTDYFTLYDHPDKYTASYDGGEFSKVIRTPSSHWRFTQSTCMTFGAKTGTLKEDEDVWMKYTSGNHPYDYEIFVELEKRGRKLAVCIPGAACHTDLTHSGSVNCVLIEPWAIETMINHYQSSLGTLPSFVNEKFGWERLVFLDALQKKKAT